MDNYVNKEPISKISNDMELELKKALDKFEFPFNSYHEGFAVIKEELDELWEEVTGDQDNEKMKKEALQVGAMAMRFLHEFDHMIGDEDVS